MAPINRTYIAITHLTRMRYPRICVAGLESGSGKHLRPTRRGGLKWEDLLEGGGSFTLGGVVELIPGFPEEREGFPEDFPFRGRGRLVKRLNGEAFWALLEQHLHQDLTPRDKAFNRGHLILALKGCFGEGLEQGGSQTWSMPEGQAKASLAKFKLRAEQVQLIEETRPDGKPVLRLSLTGQERIALTDLRLYRPPQAEGEDWTPNPAKVSELRELLRKSQTVVLSLGLSRGWSKEEGQEPRHWLQVNNIYPQTQPLWGLNL